MPNCVLCAIVDKKLPAYVVYEDAHVLAILPKEREAFGHTLVLPKKHYQDIFDIEEGALHKVMSCVKQLSLHYQKILWISWVNVLHASGKDAQQSVFHLGIIKKNVWLKQGKTLVGN